jgi:predicted nucleic acid-binding protein
MLYLHTSALIKLYFKEKHSELVSEAFRAADRVASHVLTYVEVHATFGRIKQDRKIDDVLYEKTKEDFKHNWQNYFHIQSTQELLEHAADLAENFRLRAYDSVHLAAAHKLSMKSSLPVTFACFDKTLNKAAQILGLSLLL